jgi:hypothetical protein
MPGSGSGAGPGGGGAEGLSMLPVQLEASKIAAMDQRRRAGFLVMCPS